MKYGNSNYMEVPLDAWEECYGKCRDPVGALYLYFVLKRLEHQFSSESRNYFYRTDEQLADDAKIGLATLKRYKKDLLQTDLVKTELCHFISPEGKKSEKRVTVYTLK